MTKKKRSMSKKRVKKERGFSDLLAAQSTEEMELGGRRL